MGKKRINKKINNEKKIYLLSNKIESSFLVKNAMEI
jgi:hypothetical protein